MYLPCRWEVLIFLWIHLGFVPGQDGTVNHLSKEDVLLLKDEQNPKCFSRTEEDFTCFFETSDNSTYDLFYRVGDRQEKRCELSVQRTEEDTFLHICSFSRHDIFLFVETYLEVVKRNTNTSLYKRQVHVENHVLLDPPFNVSLHPNGQVGQLQVTWEFKFLKYLEDVIYKIRYYSKGLGEKTKEVLEVDKLDSLVPGEEVEVQINTKYPQSPNTGHWSSWSQPVRAIVPQSADDISLMCYTSDLQNIICQWDKLRYGVEDGYKLFYKIGLSKTLGWTECLTDGDLTYLCCFHGDEFRKMRVKLNSTSAPLSRTFYTQEFTLNNSIKTSPPSHLKGTFEKDKLCLNWEAPLPSLATHLQYEVCYQIQEGGWLSVSPKVPETDTCLDVPMGSQYNVRIRAKPTGLVYSGHWSDWSDVLHDHTPTDRGKWLMLCIPALMLIPAVILIYLFPMYLSKLKLYFWPPVPNPKVLQGFLTEMNGQKWNPPLTAKQLSEETTCSSVVEIMSEGEVSALGKASEESTELLSPERGFSGIEEADGSPGTNVFPDYVTLNKDSVILCSKGNKYVEEKVGEKEGLVVKDDLLETCHSYCTEGSVCTPACLGTDFLNHSYLPLVDRFNCKVAVARGPGNLYTNFPCS
ncbi:Thrombopoietin receptor [Larimichthys crocea]|uniref:Thrombopoietin receptor n=1 Tax=Larimichthys crocea TaxID=215358 RepID=A0A6G0IQX3_LARCR|nr:Thrombopoietin receptor [Larimichthys crocea]